MNKSAELRRPTLNKPVTQKTIVITGASSGAGKAAALRFAREGATLVLAARREKALEEVAEECRLLGSNAIPVATDVTDAAAVKHLAQVAADFSGAIDVWINNAGVLAAGEFEKTPLEIHDQVISINLLGYIHGAHAVLPFFKAQGYGIIINNISVGGWIPTPYAVGYTASKYGLIGFADSLRAELRDWKDIHVCDLYPAFLDTPGIQHAANYTGKVLQPAPPVYSAERVAEAMLKLSIKPKNKTTTDIAAPLLRFGYSILPVLSRTIASILIKSYFKSAHPIRSTSGNVLSPVKYGTSVSGGWQNHLISKTKNTGSTALVVAGVAASLFFLHKMKTRKV